MDPVTLLLVKVVGVERVAGWMVRLVKIAVWLILVAVLVLALWLGGMEAFVRMLIYGCIGLVMWGIRTLWRRRRKAPEPDSPMERTIDGKVVPDKLAAAALEMPPYSPDGDFVLRALPDYGKVLLKLDGAEFEYLPRRFPTSPASLLEQKEEAAPNRSGLFGLPQWGIAAAVLLLVVGGGIGFGMLKASGNLQQGIQDMPEQIASQPVAASEPVQGTTDTPTQLTPPPDPSTISNAIQASRPVAEPSHVISEPRQEIEPAPAANSRNDELQETLRKVALIQTAADNGDMKAKFNMSLLDSEYWKEMGMTENLGMLRAKVELINSALGGYSPAEVRLGESYMRGIRGFDKSSEQAEVWLKKAIKNLPEDTPERRQAEALLNQLQ